MLTNAAHQTVRERYASHAILRTMYLTGAESHGRIIVSRGARSSLSVPLLCLAYYNCCPYICSLTLQRPVAITYVE
jgi:hypothetical protein